MRCVIRICLCPVIVPALSVRTTARPPVQAAATDAISAGWEYLTLAFQVLFQGDLSVHASFPFCPAAHGASPINGYYTQNPVLSVTRAAISFQLIHNLDHLSTYKICLPISSGQLHRVLCGFFQVAVLQLLSEKSPEICQEAIILHCVHHSNSVTRI